MVVMLVPVHPLAASDGLWLECALSKTRLRENMNIGWAIWPSPR